MCPHYKVSFPKVQRVLIAYLSHRDEDVPDLVAAELSPGLELLHCLSNGVLAHNSPCQSQ